MLTYKQKVFRRRRIALLIFVFAVILILFAVIYLVRRSGDSKRNTNNISAVTEPIYTLSEPDEKINLEVDVKQVVPEYPKKTSETKTFSASEINSKNGVLIDVENGTVLAERDSTDRIFPASLTKIMTLIVAVENIDDFDDTFTMTYDILAPLIRDDATRAGFVEDEAVKLEDMLYGAILPSGADATVGLAEYISGSEDDFVDLMNKKAKELGLKDTHFANTSGLYNDNHYSTSADIAVMLEYAIKNEKCREILSSYKYITSATEQHPDGIELTSTMFSRMYGTEVEGVVIEGGKTGYIYESGHCLASFAEKDGKEYIAVTIDGESKYKPIFDTFAIYENYLPSGTVASTTG